MPVILYRIFKSYSEKYKVHIIQKLMSIKIAISLFFLFTISTSACINSTEPIGKCTACAPNQVLISGFCFAKMRGCLRYLQGPACAECQNGYVLNKGLCIREGQFYNRTNLSYIPPVYITPISTLTVEEVKNKLGEKYGAYFTYAHDYFITKYSQQLDKPSIKNVQTLKTKMGDFLTIEYQINSTNKFQAVAFVSTKGQVIEWSFGSINKLRNDPVVGDKLVKNATGSRLANYFIYQFKQDGDIFTFDYMNDSFQVLRVTINRNELLTAKLSPTRFTVKILSLKDLAKQIINTKYPNLANLQITSSQQVDKYTIIKLGIAISISFKFENFAFLINNPLDTSVQIYGNSPATSNDAGFSAFSDFTDSKFKACIEYAVKQFSQLIGASINKSQSKVSNGTIFLFNLKKATANSKSFDEYELKMWYTTADIPRIIYGKKNGKFIYHTNYNYNSDRDFFNLYNSASSQSSVVNIPPISSVTYKNTGAKWYFKVVYSDLEFSEFQYIVDQDHVKLLSYYSDGQNLLVDLENEKNLAKRRSPELLLNFLKQYEPRAEGTKIKDITYNLPQYFLTIVTKWGTFNVIIQDQGQLLYNAMNKISDSTCFDMQPVFIEKSQQVKAIDEFLTSNYPLQNFEIQLVQINVLPNYYVYRILYANPNLKQIQFYLKETEDTANVIRASFINNGLEILDVNSADYQQLVNALKNSADVKGNKTPFFVQSNGSLAKAYINDGNSTNEISYDIPSGALSVNVVNVRPYLLIPQGFLMQNLIYPGNITPQQNATVTKITQEINKKYAIIIKDTTLLFVDKRNTTYNVMYRNQYGHFKVEAKVENGVVSISGRIIFTTYQIGDFSNCKKFSNTGKCLSCEIQSQIQYQGGCFKRIQGCLIQAGSSCIKCNVNFIKSGYKCYKQCSIFLK